MIVAFLLCGLVQEVDPAPVLPLQGALQGEGRQGKSREEMAAWWNGLSEEERASYRRRLEELKSLPPEAREELRRRHRALRDARKREYDNLSEDERIQLKKRSPRERRHQLDGRLRKHMERHERELRKGRGELGRPPHGGRMPDRLMQARRFIEEYRGERLQADLQKMAAEGEIAPVVLDMLEGAPLEAHFSVWSEAMRWRAYRQILRDQKRLGLSDEDLSRLATVPPDEMPKILDERGGDRKGGGRGPRQNQEPRIQRQH
ncbi:MAG: DUF3106 domain-containing protein [Planctomycetes bacterium]|nr:DUF3106 domain-containing protein [Planctomycetota bacterium]